MRSKNMVFIIICLFLLTSCSTHKGSSLIVSSAPEIPVYIEWNQQLYTNVNETEKPKKTKYLGKTDDSNGEVYEISGVDPKDKLLFVYKGVNLIETPVQFNQDKAIKFALIDENVGFSLIKRIELPDKPGKYNLIVPYNDKEITVNVEISAVEVGSNDYDVTINETWDKTKKHTWTIKSIPNETTLVAQEGDSPPQITLRGF